MGFQSGDGAFGYFAAMGIGWDNLESAFPIFNDGETILGASLTFKELEINAVDFGIESRHDAVVGSNAMAVVA